MPQPDSGQQTILVVGIRRGRFASGGDASAGIKWWQATCMLKAATVRMAANASLAVWLAALYSSLACAAGGYGPDLVHISP